MSRRGEATEAPPPRRLLESRRRGEVAFSRDLTSAAAVAAAVAALALGGPALAARAVTYLRAAPGAATDPGAAGHAGGAALAGAMAAGARALALPLGTAMAAALLVG